MDKVNNQWELWIKQAQMEYKQVLKILREAKRVAHAGGCCWLHHEKNDAGYATTSVWAGTGKKRKTVIASRLVLCYMGKPPRPYSLAENPDNAGHRTPIMCQNKNCIKPEHLYWESLEDGLTKRAKDKKLEPAIALAKKTAESMI